MGNNDIQNVSIMDYLLDYWEKLKALDLSLAEQAVYIALMYYLNRNNREQPFTVSNLQIEEMAQLSHAYAFKARKGLEKKGLIKVVPGSGKRAPAYTLILQSNTYSNTYSDSYSDSYSDTSKEYKENNNIYTNAPALDEVREFIRAHHYRVDPEAFYNHYNSLGWVNIYGVPIRHWQSTVKSWHLKNDQATDKEIKELDKINKQKKEKQRADHDSDYIHRDLPSKYDYLFTEKENT